MILIQFKLPQLSPLFLAALLLPFALNLQFKSPASAQPVSQTKRAPAQSTPAQSNPAPTANSDITQLKLGRAAFEQRDFNHALQAFYKFSQQRPNNLSVHFWLATTLAALNRNEEAVAEYTKCVNLCASINMDSPEMRNNLGNCLIRAGLSTEPLFDYKRAVLIDPKCAPPYLGLAKFLIEAGNFDEALVAIDNYQKAGGQDINAALLHGLALAGKDQYEPAKQDLIFFLREAQSGGNKIPLDRDASSFKRNYVTTGSVSPGAIDLARRILNEMQPRH